MASTRKKNYECPEKGLGKIIPAIMLYLGQLIFRMELILSEEDLFHVTNIGNCSGILNKISERYEKGTYEFVGAWMGPQ
jgi:hypothetical protein